MGTTARTPLPPRSGNGLTRLGEPKGLGVQDQPMSQHLTTAPCFSLMAGKKSLLVETHTALWPCCLENGQSSPSPRHWLHAPSPQRGKRWEKGLLELPTQVLLCSRLSANLQVASPSPCPGPWADADPPEERCSDSPRTRRLGAAGAIFLSTSSSYSILQWQAGRSAQAATMCRDQLHPGVQSPHLLHPGECSWGADQEGHRG